MPKVPQQTGERGERADEVGGRRGDELLHVRVQVPMARVVYICMV